MYTETPKYLSSWNYILKLQTPCPFSLHQVSENALNAVASPRCTELARAKSLADGFQHAREIQWAVTKAARRATASGRLNDLATPIQRVNMNVLQFNPDAFQVKPLALKAQLSSRMAELAMPINR